MLFKATIDVLLPSPSVDISLEMVGTWEKAFGIPRLAIANIMGKISLTGSAPFVKTLAAGMVYSVIHVCLCFIAHACSSFFSPRADLSVMSAFVH